MLGLLKQKRSAIPMVAALILTMLAWMMPAHVSEAEAEAAVYTMDFAGAEKTDFSGKKADDVNFAWETDLNGTLDQFVTTYNETSGKLWTVAKEGTKLKFTAKVAGALGSAGAPTAAPSTDVTIASKATAATAAVYTLDLTDITKDNGKAALNGKKIDDVAITWGDGEAVTLDTTMGAFVTAYNNASKAYKAAWASNTLTLNARTAGAFNSENSTNAATDKAPGRAPQVSAPITVSDPGTNAVYTITLTGSTEADLNTEPKKTIDGVDITWTDDLNKTMGAFVTTYNGASKAYKAEWDSAKSALTLTANAVGEKTAPTTTATTGAAKAVYRLSLTGKGETDLTGGKTIDGVAITWDSNLDTTMKTGENAFCTTYNADTSKGYKAEWDTASSTLTLTAKEVGAVEMAPTTTIPSDTAGENLAFIENTEGAAGTAVRAVEATPGTAPGASKTLSFEGTAGKDANSGQVTAVQVAEGKDATPDPTTPTTTTPTTPTTPTQPTTPTEPTEPTTPTDPTTEVKPDGTKVETTVETQPDGTKVETVIETKPDGTKTETKTETKVDGSKVESQVVTEGNGTTVKTEVITDADGTVQRESETTTKEDGSATQVVKEAQTNSAGKEVATTTTTRTDAAGTVLSEIKTAVIESPTKGTTAAVTVKTNAAGTTTATAAVTKPGTEAKSGTKGIVSAAVVKQITEAAGTADVVITQKVTEPNGSTAFIVRINARDLTAGKSLSIVKLDKKGNPVLVNAKTYKVSEAGNVGVTMAQGGTYQLLNRTDAKKVSNAILKTVQAKKKGASVKTGKKTTMALSSKLNKSNVAKITYSSSNKAVAKVSKNGTVTAKKKGTALVKAKVTLKNGTSKTVQMKVKVK